MAEEIRLMGTGDGSHTLLNVMLNETYHSRHGALRESQHVFIKAGLSHWLNLHADVQNIKIFEMGMGTGLNLILTLQQALQLPKLKFDYLSLEAYPLKSKIIAQLNYVELLQDPSLIALFKKIHEAEWNSWQEILPNFQLNKVHQKLEDFQISEKSADLIYYDAFAPNKQAELWSLDTIKKVCSMLKENGVFVTYCAKGQLKRDLKSLGLKLETLAGPPGKAEMVRATK
ncbi:tRNA U34 5-methylaminomethyl-2-thiouridine-forming methyltransferase MnmC [Catalinimonas alkaloidigena]|uniref:tRNA (5-methylaminomethyl-2-thiouridine)(34)-methyltransferase MnmD n=1 Tax=Catalinimonas alkaloidigena TaxID=1075417 RepID=UPI002406F72A|nr:tRNA (5-methylaminomethyl-2-thiouridine)(34)-methyltransferase MnmD [Catalinimonas alkaloidigena]MDF9797406.1 tRNA U34 5-methylaminomethyl-2-thiouridine-forming methyltransferase MnmC [Catalinimonas alkaloidigena]